jgi:integrase/recombinase XerD
MELMALAEAATDRRHRVNAVIFRDGLLIAALAHRPLRRRNWAGLRIGIELIPIDGRWWIVLRPRKVKNRKSARIPWPAELVPALEHYLKVYRPLLLGETTDNRTAALW